MEIGYHFVGETLRDGRPVPPIGEWLVHDGPMEICESGLHWSRHPFDALPYATGKYLCLVECSNPAEEQNDKCVSRRRKILKKIDATNLLRGFARWRAYQVLHLWDAPKVVIDYITSGDEALRIEAQDVAAAYDVAFDAAVDAAWSATFDAAWDGDEPWAETRDDFKFLVDLEFEKNGN